MLRVTRTIHFSTSLRYWLEDESEEENRKRFGREADRHGHNYRLEITVAGEPDPQTGMVINLVDLKNVAEREIMSRFDHKDLNLDTDYFVSIPPTPEHFASSDLRPARMRPCPRVCWTGSDSMWLMIISWM